MNVDEYRKQYGAELDKIVHRDRGRRRVSTRSGVKPTSSLTAASASDSDVLTEQIAKLGNSANSVDERLHALQSIQAASFLGQKFDRYRASYRDALRVAATDADPELRETALELLAIDKDEVARDLLVKSLEDPKHELVSPGKAVQLLAHDDHGVAVPMARKIVNGDYDVEAKAEALRVLASDPTSDELLAGLLSDSSQPKELRSASAAGLRLVNPQRFEMEARKVIIDVKQPAEVRAACLGALAHLQGSAAISEDAKFRDAVAKLDRAGTPGPLRAAASRFLRGRKS